MCSNGPNSLNLNSYAYGEHEENIDQSRSENEQEPMPQQIQQQFDAFIQDVRKYDEIVSKANQNLEEVSAEEHFITDFYPKFALECTYEQDGEKRIVEASDPEMGKILANLERENKLLKEEIKGWLFEFAKKTRLSEVLITDNANIRKCVSAKNKEIVKLIEAITRTQNHDLTELSSTLSELKEENGVLLAHLAQLKYELADKKELERELLSAYDKAEQQKIEIQAKITQAEDEEEHNSKMVTLLENSTAESTKRESRLRAEKERLTKILQDFQKDEHNIQKEMEACNIDKQEIEKNLKSKFKGHQTEKERIMNEIEEISIQVNAAKHEAHDHQAEILKNEKKIEEFTSLCNDLDRRIGVAEENMKKGQRELAEVTDVEVQFRSDINMIDYEIEVLKEEIRELQEAEQEQEQRNKAELRQVEKEKKAEVDRLTEELRRVERESCNRVLHQQDELAAKKKEVQVWERKVAEKNHELADLKNQMKEIKENQAKVVQLRKRVREARPG